jgi:hypothetical protein
MGVGVCAVCVGFDIVSQSHSRESSSSARATTTSSSSRKNNKKNISNQNGGGKFRNDRRAVKKIKSKMARIIAL